jgi:hypothetical protein
LGRLSCTLNGEPCHQRVADGRGRGSEHAVPLLLASVKKLINVPAAPFQLLDAES